MADGIAFLEGDARIEAAWTFFRGLQARVGDGERPSPEVMAFAQKLGAKRGQVEATSGQTARPAGRNGDDGDAMHHLLGLDDAARALACSPRTVRRRVAEGSLPARRDGRRLLFDRADLDAYLAALDTA